MFYYSCWNSNSNTIIRQIFIYNSISIDFDITSNMDSAKQYCTYTDINVITNNRKSIWFSSITDCGILSNETIATNNCLFMDYNAKLLINKCSSIANFFLIKDYSPKILIAPFINMAKGNT